MNKITAFLILIATLLFPQTALATDATLTAQYDTYVNNQSPTQSYGNDNGLYSYYQPASKHSRIYIKFNHRDIPPAATITSAKLKLYLLASTGVSPVNLEVFRTTGTWSETMNWNDQNDLLDDNNRYAVKAISNTLGWKEWDVKNLLQDWVSGRKSNSGLMIIFQSGVGDDYSRTFFSSEVSGDFKPKLEVSYTVPTPTPASTTRLNVTLNPNFILPVSVSNIRKWETTSSSIRITWDSTLNGSSWIYYGDSSDGIDRFELQTGQNDSTRSHSVTLTNLTPGKTYSYKVMTRASSSNYKYSGIDHFTTMAAETPAEAEPAPEPEATTTPTPADDKNPVENVKSGIENKLAEFAIENSSEKDNPAIGEPGTDSVTQTDQLKSANPLVLIAGSVGINRLAGILMIVAGLLTLLLIYLLMHTTKKVHQHIKSNYFGNPNQKGKKRY